jgi:hypothetical protein
MKIRNNTKLKDFKLTKILNEINEANKIDNYSSFNKMYLKTNPLLKKNGLINEKIINKSINKSENKYYLSKNKKNKIEFLKSFDNGMKCFSVPQTLNYYGKNNIKAKATKEALKMNRILMKNNINNLALPKRSLINSQRNYNNYKLNSNRLINNNIIFNLKKNNFCLNELSKKAKKKMTLYELEKKREKERYNEMLREKFLELETCEKKFDIVIEETLKKLNEEKNLYNYNNS